MITPKVGVVVCVVNSGEEPWQALRRDGIEGVAGEGGPRNHVSYVVRVGKKRLLWPRVKNLRLSLRPAAVSQ
jgi:hypothetical protein